MTSMEKMSQPYPGKLHLLFWKSKLRIWEHNKGRGIIKQKLFKMLQLYS